MLRYHFFLCLAPEGEYSYLLDDHDREMLKMGKTVQSIRLSILKIQHRLTGTNCVLIPRSWRINIYLKRLKF